MKSRLIPPFRTLFNALAEDEKARARRAFALFQENPRHSGLHFKMISARHSVWSVRIGLHYRALGIVRGEEVLWFWIGSHAEYDKQLKQFR